MIRWCTIYIPSKFAKVPLYNISGPADLIASISKKFEYNHKSLFEDFTKEKEEKVVKRNTFEN